MSYNYLLGWKTHRNWVCRHVCTWTNFRDTRRHREGTRKQVQGTRAKWARASTTRTQKHTVSVNKQAGKRTNEGKVRAGRCRVRAHRKDMQCKHPGKAPDVSLSLSITLHNWPPEKCDPRWFLFLMIYLFIYPCPTRRPPLWIMHKYLKAGPPEMPGPLRNWYNCCTKHFPQTSVVWWKQKAKLDWVINPVPHDLVRRIRFWRIKSPEHDFTYLYWTIRKIPFWFLFTCKGTYKIGRRVLFLCLFIKSKPLARLVQQKRILSTDEGAVMQRTEVAEESTLLTSIPQFKNIDPLLLPSLHFWYTRKDRGPPSGLVHNCSIWQPVRESPTQQLGLSTD